MKWIIWSGVVAVGLLGAAMLAVRLAPSDPAVWHVDPLVAGTAESSNGFLARPEGGDMAGRVFAADPATVVVAFGAVAAATPRVVRLAGDAASGHVTYVARSALWRFPDYVSVKAVPVAEGTRLAIWSRARFGQSDLGVNRARVEDWLARLAADLPAS